MKIYENMLQLVGNTPIVKLNRLSSNCKSDIYVKLERFNPSGSVKDRAALNMILTAEREGKINKDTTIIEATSGNTGVALATIAAAKGYKLILFIPGTMSVDKMNYIRALGAEIRTTPGIFGMKKAYFEAHKLYEKTENAFMPNQIENPANPDAHTLTTAYEIWNDMEGKVDYFVASSGTGGTVSGTGKSLKKLNSNIKVICVEPYGSPVLSGGRPGPHKIQGVGPGFIPLVTDISVFDQIVCIKDDDALQTARNMARMEGMFVGISSGAAVFAAMEIAQKEEGKNIVVIAPDTGERYLNTELFNDEYSGVFV